MKLLSAICLLLVLTMALALPAHASKKKPSVKTCEEMGELDIRCYVCKTGEYKGKVSVRAQYDPQFGDCAGRYREARELCSRAYQMPYSRTGTRWQHSMDGTNFTGSYPDSCKK